MLVHDDPLPIGSIDDVAGLSEPALSFDQGLVAFVDDDFDAAEGFPQLGCWNLVMHRKPEQLELVDRDSRVRGKVETSVIPASGAAASGDGHGGPDCEEE